MAYRATDHGRRRLRYGSVRRIGTVPELGRLQILARGFVMTNTHPETAVEKAVAYVKDVLGLQSEPARENEAPSDYPDTAPEVTAENAMRLNPDAYAAHSIGPMDADAFVPPMDETDTERLRREVGEYPVRKSALELNAESARAEDGE